ncbi:hypothetical protein K9B33_02390 [Sphingobium sp. 3R8]|uniref:hypothetical protein n=1 Tax=Sphingobium sp. 3R8 TaxID=2874921 RepID=UPI001CCD5A86|nr:hypothetical protein [Sphingobium sp. 3R8]MBZ9646381.1 hypothetical protein [Sphingobium sp. 3R8]
MQQDWDQRQNWLVIGTAYRVASDAPSFPAGSDFRAGEAVCLQHVEYARYDGCHIYRFQAENEVKSYWLSDDAPIDDLTNVFVEMLPPAPLP